MSVLRRSTSSFVDGLVIEGASSFVVRPQLNTSPSYPLTTPNVVPFGIQTLVDVRLANGTKVTLAASNACPADTLWFLKVFLMD